MTVSRSVGGLFNAAFQGTRTGPGGYEGPGFVVNESEPAPAEAPQAAMLPRAIFCLSASQTVRTSDVISEHSSIWRK